MLLVHVSPTQPSRTVLLCKGVTEAPCTLLPVVNAAITNFKLHLNDAPHLARHHLAHGWSTYCLLYSSHSCVLCKHKYCPIVTSGDTKVLQARTLWLLLANCTLCGGGGGGCLQMVEQEIHACRIRCAACCSVAFCGSMFWKACRPISEAHAYIPGMRARTQHKQPARGLRHREEGREGVGVVGSALYRRKGKTNVNRTCRRYHHVQPSLKEASFFVCFTYHSVPPSSSYGPPLKGGVITTVEHAACTYTHIIEVRGQEPGLCSPVARDCNIQVWLVLEEPGY